MIKVGSDFSGVGAFDQALIRLGIEHETVFACDMDKYARQTYTLNFGEPKYYPENVYDRIIPSDSLDIYMSSPPCQAFSLAGKRKGEADKRGILFYNTHEFICKNKPRYFIIENVKGLLSDAGGKTFQNWLDLLGGKSINGKTIMFPNEDAAPYHIHYQVLNAKHYGVPQNRERVFIVGIRDDEDNSFRFPAKVPLLKRLRDVLEEFVDEKYYLSEKMINCLQKNADVSGFEFSTKDINKSANCVTTNEAKMGTRCNYIQTEQLGFINQDTQASKVYSANGTAPNICAGTHGYALGYIHYGNSQDQKQFTPLDINGIGKTVRTGGKGSLTDKHNWDVVSVPQTLNAGHFNQPKVLQDTIIEHRGHKNKEATFIHTGIVPTLRAESHGHESKVVVVKFERTEEAKIKRAESLKIGIDSGTFADRKMTTRPQDYSDTILANPNPVKDNLIATNRIRRLTPTECMKLMSFNPDFIERTINSGLISDTQLYRQAGNSIVVDVLAAIINNLKLNTK